MSDKQPEKSHRPDVPDSDETEHAAPFLKLKREIGGPKGLEPTRYGDWEKAGRCIDF